MSEPLQPISGFDRRNDDSLVIEINLDEAVESRLKMANDGIIASECCNCELNTKAVIKTCWSGNNKGRRVMTCQGEKGVKCNFNVFLDEPFSARVCEVIQHMYSVIEKLEFENAVGMGLQKLTWLDYEEEDPNVRDAGEDQSG